MDSKEAVGQKRGLVLLDGGGERLVTDADYGLGGAARRPSPQAFKSKHLDLPVARKLHGPGAAEYVLEEMEKQADRGAEAGLFHLDQDDDEEADFKEHTLAERNEDIHGSQSMPL